MNTEEIEKGKTTAVVSYVLLVGAFIALSMNSEDKNKFASFHIRQALGLTILFMGTGLLISNFDTTQMPQILMSFWIFFSILFCFGIITAIKGQMIPIPVIGNLFQKVFKNL